MNTSISFPTTNTFAPSRYQQAIFDFIESGTGNAVIDAVAGSGKTTTLIEAAKLLPSDCKALFVAFNKHIADPLGEKLRSAGVYNMEASTLHSLGKRFLGKTQLDTKKYRTLCNAYLINALPIAAFSAEKVEMLGKLVNFSQLTMTDPTEKNLITLVRHYDLDIDVANKKVWEPLWKGVQPVIEAGIRQYQNAGIIDFNDMILLPTVLGLAQGKYDYVLTDECQDLNRAQLELVTSVCKQSGRMIFVGDKYQSIYGFTGADTQSMDNIIERTHATILPLSICYRCPSSHVELAAQIYSGIEAAPNAKRGEIAILDASDLPKYVLPVKHRDLVLCRTTAPLVSKCLSLLREGIPATVRGKDIGKSLLDIVEKVKKSPDFCLETLAELVSQYGEHQIAILSKIPDSELKVESLNDKIETLLCLLEAYLGKSSQDASINGFYTYVQGFFSDDTGDVVMFSTVHKAKGLEFENVYILRSDLFPHPAAKKGWQIEQEYNIEYVALTRAKKALYFVGCHPTNITLVCENIAKFFEALAEYATQQVEAETKTTIVEQEEVEEGVEVGDAVKPLERVYAKPTNEVWVKRDLANFFVKLAEWVSLGCPVDVVEVEVVEVKEPSILLSLKSEKGTGKSANGGKREGAGRKKNSEKGIAAKEVMRISVDVGLIESLRTVAGERGLGEYITKLLLQDATFAEAYKKRNQ